MDKCKKTKELNTKLIELIKSNKIDPLDLAIAMEKTPFNFRNWINGKKDYSFKTLVKIAEALNLDVEIILKEK